MRFTSPLLLMPMWIETTAVDLDEPYHHTQLLQSKLHHGKVSVDARGDLSSKDDSVFFQEFVDLQSVKSQEACFLREDNLWAPEDIPPYIACLKSSCQDFDPSRIFDGMSCGDIIGMGFTCTEEIPGANHIPSGTTLSDMCSATCSACEGGPADLQPAKPQEAVCSTVSKQCIFPFVRDGITYTSCTAVGSDAPWCATSVDASGGYQSQQWGFCDAGGSQTVGKPCVFPFVYEGTAVTSCTAMNADAPWCATSVDASGAYMSQQWGFCDANLC